MDSLKTQLDDLRAKAEKDITEILQGFSDKTGYVPTSINVDIVDVSTNKETAFIVDKIDLAFGR